MMEKSKKIAEPLLTISRIIKSQKKIVGQRLAELKRCLRLFSIAWRQGFPARGVWLKFHRLEHHVIQFIELFGMVGRVSEEGFESHHPLLNSSFNDGKSIVSTQRRVNCMGRKLCSGASADIQKIMVQVKDATSRPEKGPSRDAAAKRTGEDRGDLASSAPEEDEAGEHLIMSEREMTPKPWQDLFLLLTHNEAPREWSGVFRDCKNLMGEEIKVKSEHCSHQIKQNNRHVPQSLSSIVTVCSAFTDLKQKCFGDIKATHCRPCRHTHRWCSQSRTVGLH